MSEVTRPYLRVKREHRYSLRIDIFHRDGTQGASIVVKTGSLEQGIQFLFTTESGDHAFFVFPESDEERGNNE